MSDTSRKGGGIRGERGRRIASSESPLRSRLSRRDRSPMVRQVQRKKAESRAVSAGRPSQDTPVPPYLVPRIGASNESVGYADDRASEDISAASKSSPSNLGSDAVKNVATRAVGLVQEESSGNSGSSSEAEAGSKTGSRQGMRVGIAAKVHATATNSPAMAPHNAASPSARLRGRPRNSLANHRSLGKRLASSASKRKQRDTTAASNDSVTTSSQSASKVRNGEEDVPDASTVDDISSSAPSQPSASGKDSVPLRPARIIIKSGHPEGSGDKITGGDSVSEEEPGDTAEEDNEDEEDHNQLSLASITAAASPRRPGIRTAQMRRLRTTSPARRKMVQMTQHADVDGRGQDGNVGVNGSGNGGRDHPIVLGSNILSRSKDKDHKDHKDGDNVRPGRGVGDDKKENHRRASNMDSTSSSDHLNVTQGIQLLQQHNETAMMEEKTLSPVKIDSMFLAQKKENENIPHASPRRARDHPALRSRRGKSKEPSPKRLATKPLAVDHHQDSGERIMSKIKVMSQHPAMLRSHSKSPRREPDEDQDSGGDYRLHFASAHLQNSRPQNRSFLAESSKSNEESNRKQIWDSVHHHSPAAARSLNSRPQKTSFFSEISKSEGNSDTEKVQDGTHQHSLSSIQPQSSSTQNKGFLARIDDTEKENGAKKDQGSEYHGTTTDNYSQKIIFCEESHKKTEMKEKEDSCLEGHGTVKTPWRQRKESPKEEIEVDESIDGNCEEVEGTEREEEKENKVDKRDDGRQRNEIESAHQTITRDQDHSETAVVTERWQHRSSDMLSSFGDDEEENASEGDSPVKLEQMEMESRALALQREFEAQQQFFKMAQKQHHHPSREKQQHLLSQQDLEPAHQGPVNKLQRPHQPQYYSEDQHQENDQCELIHRPEPQHAAGLTHNLHQPVPNPSSSQPSWHENISDQHSVHSQSTHSQSVYSQSTRSTTSFQPQASSEKSHQMLQSQSGQYGANMTKDQYLSYIENRRNANSPGNSVMSDGTFQNSMYSVTDGTSHHSGITQDITHTSTGWEPQSLTVNSHEKSQWPHSNFGSKATENRQQPHTPQMHMRSELDDNEPYKHQKYNTFTQMNNAMVPEQFLLPSDQLFKNRPHKSSQQNQAFLSTGSGTKIHQKTVSKLPLRQQDGGHHHRHPLSPVSAGSSIAELSHIAPGAKFPEHNTKVTIQPAQLSAHQPVALSGQLSQLSTSAEPLQHVFSKDKKQLMSLQHQSEPLSPVSSHMSSQGSTAEQMPLSPMDKQLPLSPDSEGGLGNSPPPNLGVQPFSLHSDKSPEAKMATTTPRAYRPLENIESLQSGVDSLGSLAFSQYQPSPQDSLLSPPQQPSLMTSMEDEPFSSAEESSRLSRKEKDDNTGPDIPEGDGGLDEAQEGVPLLLHTSTSSRSSKAEDTGDNFLSAMAPPPSHKAGKGDEGDGHLTEDTPVSSWWKNIYADTQDDYVNSVVEQALSPPKHDFHSIPKKKEDNIFSSGIALSSSRPSAQSTLVHSRINRVFSDDSDDDIFSGIIFDNGHNSDVEEEKDHLEPILYNKDNDIFNGIGSPLASVPETTKSASVLSELFSGVEVSGVGNSLGGNSGGGNVLATVKGTHDFGPEVEDAGRMISLMDQVDSGSTTAPSLPLKSKSPRTVKSRSANKRPHRQEIFYDANAQFQSLPFPQDKQSDRFGIKGNTIEIHKKSPGGSITSDMTTSVFHGGHDLIAKSPGPLTSGRFGSQLVGVEDDGAGALHSHKVPMLSDPPFLRHDPKTRVITEEETGAATSNSNGDEEIDEFDPDKHMLASVGRSRISGMSVSALRATNTLNAMHGGVSALSMSAMSKTTNTIASSRAESTDTGTYNSILRKGSSPSRDLAGEDGSITILADDLTNQSSKGAESSTARNGFFSRFSCGALEAFTGGVFNSDQGFLSKCSDKTAKPGKGDNGSSDYDEGSSDDGDNDTDFGSKSEGVSLAPTATTDASAHLSTKERSVWDEWDRKDTETLEASTINGGDSTGFGDQTTLGDTTAFTSVTGITRLEQMEEDESRAKHLERRARAHGKLLLHAYTALSTPYVPPNREKGEELARDTVQTTQNKEQTGVFNEEHLVPEILQADIPESIEDKENNFRAFSENAVTTAKAPSPHTVGEGRTSKTIMIQRQRLENFCFTLRNHGMEVLKLNRDNKWQPRFLTVSREILWLSHDTSGNSPGDRSYCPQGMLWMKKFNNGKDYSVDSIDKYGKGGMFLSQLTRISMSPGKVAEFPLTRKQLIGKFKDSIVVVLRSEFSGISRSVVLRCFSVEEAQFLCTGCAIIIDMLSRNARAKEKSVEKISLEQSHIVASELGLGPQNNRAHNSAMNLGFQGNGNLGPRDSVWD